EADHANPFLCELREPRLKPFELRVAERTPRPAVDEDDVERLREVRGHSEPFPVSQVQIECGEGVTGVKQSGVRLAGHGVVLLGYKQRSRGSRRLRGPPKNPNWPTPLVTHGVHQPRGVPSSSAVS